MNSYTKRADITNPRTYLTHYNGGRPFKVVVSAKKVDVFVRPRAHDVEAEHSVLALTVPRFQGYWRGRDPTGLRQHGSSLLIKENDADYVFIGGEVYRFSPEEEIVDFLSPMGNSDVPYPVAYGETRIYFMLEKLSLPKVRVGAGPALDIAGRIYGNECSAAPFRHLRQVLKQRLFG